MFWISRIILGSGFLSDVFASASISTDAPTGAAGSGVVDRVIQGAQVEFVPTDDVFRSSWWISLKKKKYFSRDPSFMRLLTKRIGLAKFTREQMNVLEKSADIHEVENILKAAGMAPFFIPRVLHAILEGQFPELEDAHLRSLRLCATSVRAGGKAQIGSIDLSRAQLSDDTLEKIIGLFLESSLNYVEFIDLRHCNGFTDSGLKVLARAFPKAKIVRDETELGAKLDNGFLIFPELPKSQMCAYAVDPKRVVQFAHPGAKIRVVRDIEVDALSAVRIPGMLYTNWKCSYASFGDVHIITSFGVVARFVKLLIIYLKMGN